jgi:hypothetical protein
LCFSLTYFVLVVQLLRERKLNISLNQHKDFRKCKQENWCMSFYVPLCEIKEKKYEQAVFLGFFNPNCFRSKTLFLCHVLRVRRKVSLARKVNYFYQELKTLSSLSKLFCNFLLFYCFRIFRKMKGKMVEKKIEFFIISFYKIDAL